MNLQLVLRRLSRQKINTTLHIVGLTLGMSVCLLIALAISSPLTYYWMHNWLQNFAFHIDIRWNVFVIVGMVSLLLSLLTVSFQALKAAWANPVES